jgi:class 3 adenylate cyclase
LNAALLDGKSLTATVPEETFIPVEGARHLARQIPGARLVELPGSEYETFGDKITGIAVHIGARVAALAGPGEVLVSSTVKDLIAGSGLGFSDRGFHGLKGVPVRWRVFAAQP